MSGARGPTGDIQAYSRDVFGFATFDEPVGDSKIVVPLCTVSNMLGETKGRRLLPDKIPPMSRRLLARL